MEQFYFNVERKITTWVRELHSIRAETKEEAVEKMIAEFKDNELDADTFCEQEHLYDTDTLLSIEENDGNATCELYFDGEGDREFIIDNLNNTTN
jgi:hypothetical protein